MVRVNLIDPKKLADQHLIAEYDEILMLCGYIERYPSREGIPESYRLGKGHIKFFKDKISYLAKRHDILKQEMRNRTFTPTKTINLAKFDKNLINDWVPSKKDFSIIKERLRYKLNLKPNWYRYYGKQKNADFFIKLLD